MKRGYGQWFIDAIRAGLSWREARVHWRAYLRQDPRSTWADQVRERLKETAGSR